MSCPISVGRFSGVPHWPVLGVPRGEYEALEEEFSLAAALIEARARAGLTQEQVAQRMKTTQAVIARLEGGGSMPSTRTLEKYAKATGTRLRISFEPEGARP
jgi:ribosome-binding protein aMBF1 (putative translation factor)